jgi:hypothetical protein
MASVPELIAHGGVGGAIAEGFFGIAVVAVFVSVWLRERRARADGRAGDEARLRNDGDGSP